MELGGALGTLTIRLVDAFVVVFALPFVNGLHANGHWHITYTDIAPRIPDVHRSTYGCWFPVLMHACHLGNSWSSMVILGAVLL